MLTTLFRVVFNPPTRSHLSIKDQFSSWPLPDICLFIRGLCTSQYYSWHSTPPLLHPLPLYVVINIAQYMVSLRPPCVTIQHTTLVMAISCKDLFSSPSPVARCAHLYLRCIRSFITRPPLQQRLMRISLSTTNPPLHQKPMLGLTREGDEHRFLMEG